MFKKIFIVVIVFALFIIGFVLYKNRLVTPKKIYINLYSTINNNKRIPILDLYASVGNGCDLVSDLEIEKTQTDSNLVVNIKGYHYTQGGGTCIQIAKGTGAEITLDPDWLSQNNNKEINIILNGIENHYKISYSDSDYLIKLKLLLASNVILQQSSNVPNTQQTLQLLLYPTDVTVISPGGKGMSLKKNYNLALREFSQEMGFTPAENVYPGIKQSTGNAYYIKTHPNYPLPPLNQNKVIGKLANEDDVVVLINWPQEISKIILE